jgi:hypothetical protein
MQRQHHMETTAYGWIRVAGPSTQVRRRLKVGVSISHPGSLIWLKNKTSRQEKPLKPHYLTQYTNYSSYFTT